MLPGAALDCRFGRIGRGSTWKQCEPVAKVARHLPAWAAGCACGRAGGRAVVGSTQSRG